MRNVTEQSQSRMLNQRESLRKNTGRGHLPNRFVRRKVNAAINRAQREPDMDLEEITCFLESVSLD
jgi:hypothetical protein